MARKYSRNFKHFPNNILGVAPEKLNQSKFHTLIFNCYKDVYVNSFFPRTARLWNSLPIECFPLTYDLSGFKSRINRYFLIVGSF